jgi:hypothetical protein
MKLFKFYIVNEVILIDSDGSSKCNFLAIDFTFCSNYYNLENYLI